ncbi:F-box protein At3g12350-like [Primulina eburnea]|uniref:F-box protein At3g12350-like n=1 Tax=Primulina eburnea TaxID=1245227 RepID=UPI003C6C2AD0
MVYLDTSNGTLSLTEEDLLREDSEKLRSTELIIAKVRTEKYDALMQVSENHDFLEFRRRLSIANGLIEEYENVYSSPPDGLMTQIREALTKTVSVPVPDESSSKKLNSRQRRRRRRENLMMDALQWEVSYFLQLHKRYDNYSRSPDQPLQGLWKGIARGKSLNFYIVTYTICFGQLSCKMAGNSVTSQINAGLVFSASMEPFIEPPFSSREKHIYDSRLHLRPAEYNQPDPTSSDVLRIFYANLGPGSSAPKDPRNAGGRIWLYADGTFGFGSLKDHFIIDLKPMVEDDNLLDVVI